MTADCGLWLVSVLPLKVGSLLFNVALWCKTVNKGVMKSKKRKKFVSGPALVALAEAAEPIMRLRDFLPAVDKLREKGYSWRACAEWLGKNAGVELDHTSLMRLSEHREHLDPDDA